MDGRDDMMNCGHILASNDTLHRPLLDLLRAKNNQE